MRLPGILIFLPFLLLFAFSGFAQQTTVAVLPSESASLSNDELEALTDKMREAALKVLPTNAFILLKQDVVIKRLGGMDNYIKECKESSCIVDLGKKAQVDYVVQASVGKLSGKIRLKVELYNVSSGGLLGMHNEYFDNFFALLEFADKNVPDLFRKIPGASRGKSSSPSFAEGIGGVQTIGGDYEFDGGKSYLANITTEPEGAVLSFDGAPDVRCAKTPCKALLAEGNIRIVAALEQYERADTTVFIKQNNQNINIRLKASFGVLEIKPAYSEGIGESEPWSLSINGKYASSWVNSFSPNNYKVELSHRCYEILNFEAGINNDRREVFDMAGYVKLKMGGLVLNAEKNGELMSEPVYVNSKRVGETPFSGTVPVCAEIWVGESREKVNVELKHNEKVVHKYIIKNVPVNQEESELHAKKDNILWSSYQTSDNSGGTGGKASLEEQPGKFLEIGYQRIWDMNHIRFSYGGFYSVMGYIQQDVYDRYGGAYDHSSFDWVAGFIHRWIRDSIDYPNSLLFTVGFGLFGGFGARHTTEDSEITYTNATHELGVEFILGYFSLYIAERNFHRIGSGIGLIF